MPSNHSSVEWVRCSISSELLHAGDNIVLRRKLDKNESLPEVNPIRCVHPTKAKYTSPIGRRNRMSLSENEIQEINEIVEQVNKNNEIVESEV